MTDDEIYEVFRHETWPGVTTHQPRSVSIVHWFSDVAAKLGCKLDLTANTTRYLGESIRSYVGINVPTPHICHDVRRLMFRRMFLSVMLGLGGKWNWPEFTFMCERVIAMSQDTNNDHPAVRASTVSWLNATFTTFCFGQLQNDSFDPPAVIAVCRDLMARLMRLPHVIAANVDTVYYHDSVDPLIILAIERLNDELIQAPLIYTVGSHETGVFSGAHSGQIHLY